MAARARETLVRQARTRKLTIVAQDPAVEGSDGEILTTEVDVPAEELARGPCLKGSFRLGTPDLGAHRQ